MNTNQISDLRFVPLPNPIPDPPFEVEFTNLKPSLPERFKRLIFRSLREGCYLLNYTPNFYPNPLFPRYQYVGTMRVEREGLNTIASGDLYYHSNWIVLPRPGFCRSFNALPDPGRGIPIFSRGSYRYYLRVTQILEFITLGNSFTLGFEMYRFDASTNTFQNEGLHTAEMKFTIPSGNYPSKDNYLEGTLKDSSGNEKGKLTMGWISTYFRKVTLEVDRVAQSEFPGDNGDDIDWNTVFEKIGYDIDVIESEINLSEVSGDSWSNAELHSAMLDKRDYSNLDEEWRYHLLCVRRLDYTSRGVMYDARGTDSNNVPREGAAIASHWEIPDTSRWGTVRGQRFGASAAPYFRTAVHELGHALGLYHNSQDNGFMNTTGEIASSRGTFPSNIQWTFNSGDEKRLKHFPDIWVRPGGIPFGNAYSSAPISPNDAEAIPEVAGFDLTVHPLIDSFPLGAPVRLHLELTNSSEVELLAPEHINTKSEHISGTVKLPSGGVRRFQSIIRCIEDHQLELLKPGASISDDLIIIRGTDGPLFPMPGIYEINVQVTWDVEGQLVRKNGSASILITPAVNTTHASAAAKILSTPDTQLNIVIGGDHLKEGLRSIHQAMKTDELRCHFEAIEACRLADRFKSRKPALDKALELINEDTMLTGNELNEISSFVLRSKASFKETKKGKAKIDLLKAKAKTIPISSQYEDLVKKL